MHLGGADQPVHFHAGVQLQRVVERQTVTKLTSFFQLCTEDEFAATLLYHQVSRYFTWQQPTRSWRRRRRGERHPDEAGIFAAEAVGRVDTVSPRTGERFFLRLLLHNVRGPRSFEGLRTVGGHVYGHVSLYGTYREACSALGLLEDTQHWHRAMAEAAVISFPRQLRRLFALIAIEGRGCCDLRLLWHTGVRRRLQRLDRPGADEPIMDDGDGGGGGDAEHAVLAEALRLIGHQLRLQPLRRVGGLTLQPMSICLSLRRHCRGARRAAHRRQTMMRSSGDDLIILGDLNAHHPLWDSECDAADRTVSGSD